MTQRAAAPQAMQKSRTAIHLGLAALVFHLVLIQPNHPAAMTYGALLVFPLELPVILLALIAMPRRPWVGYVRVVLVVALTVIVLLKAADFAMFTALARGFNPVADLALIGAGLRLLVGAIGVVTTIAAVFAAFIALAAVVAALWWASGVWARVEVPSRVVPAVIAASILTCGLAAAEIGHAMGRWVLPVAPPGAAFAARVGVERVEMVRATLADLRAFEAAALNDPYATRNDLLGSIDRDVLFIFVESYGRTSLDTPFYADTHRATLERAERHLADLSYSMRSGFLEAPTRGGQSWLSHATFANGLWIADQTSYGAVLASGRRTLFHVASAAGFRTAAVMPQITLDWPEADLMGFETVLQAQDLGYAGLPFNWVTMPDQFTFVALDRLLRNGSDARPLMVQVATGSSHAPWVPVPEIVDWDEIEDGEIFNAMASAGDPPEVVWRDRSRVRTQFRLAVDYALNVVFEYVARHSADPPLIFVIGDHQAAEFVALDDRPHVPVHVIGPEALVAPVADWGWEEGLIPEEDLPVRSMANMRDLILEAYSAPVEEATDS